MRRDAPSAFLPVPAESSALADVVREARGEELQRLAEDLDQLELFEAPRLSNGAPVQVASHRGPGRPVGARNKRTDEAALPILAPGVLPELAKVLGLRSVRGRWLVERHLCLDHAVRPPAAGHADREAARIARGRAGEPAWQPKKLRGRAR
jgi:hypothetical protein